jgi:hypothetical protein
MKDLSESCLVELNLIDGADLLHSGGSVVFLTGALYREAQVKHPRCARFSVKNDRGLFFVKVYQADLVNLAKSLEQGAKLVVIGEMHSFVSRRCKNHHVFIKAVALFPLTEASEGWKVKIETCPEPVEGMARIVLQ